MKIVIIGAGLTGLYIGYMLKKINMDFDIYERSSRVGGRIKNINAFNNMLECGSNLIQPYHFNTIQLLNELKLHSKEVTGKKILTLSNKVDETVFNNLLKKILKIYEKNKSSNMSAKVFIQSILSKTDYNIFISYVFNQEMLENEVSDFMKYLIYDLKLSNCISGNQKIPNCIANKYIQVIGGTQLITNRLASFVQDSLYLNHELQEIFYQPLTNKYILTINDKYINADKVILACNSSISKIKLFIPSEIVRSIQNVKPIEHIRLYTLHNSSVTSLLKLHNVIQSQSILTNISSISENILGMSYIYGSKAELLYKMLSNETSKKEIIEILNKLIENISGIKFPPIIDYVYCFWQHGYHINKKQIKTNFWHKHNLILAGEWVHSYHNTLEGSCMSAIKTFKIISDPLFVDKLIHQSDNVKNIEGNRKK